MVAVRRALAAAPRTLALLLVLLLTPAVARADFMEAYRAGTDAAERGDWVAVERLMEEAIAERPEPAQRLARYLHFKPYIPHYYLGLSRFRQGDCPGALESWEEAERREIVRSDEEAWRRIIEGREECRRVAERRRRFESLAEEAKELLAEAYRLASGLEELAGDPKLESARRQDPSFDQRRRDLERELDRSRRKLRAAVEAGPDTPDEPPVTRRELAAERERLERGEAALTELRSALSQRQAGVEQRLASERDRLAALRDTARALLEETEDLAEEFPGVAEERGELAEELAAADADAFRGTGLAELVLRRQRLTAAVGSTRAAAEAPPAGLLAAADAYFAGDLELAVDLAEDAELETPKARAHAALLRAAARFSLWQAEGGGNLELLEAARRDVRAAREADPEIAPLPSAFSPRFLAFFEANLPAAGDDETEAETGDDPAG